MSKDVLTPEEVLAQEELNNSVSLDFASKEDSDVVGFLPLKEGQYEVTCQKAEVRERPKWGKPEEMENVLVITFQVDKCLTEDAIFDVEDQEQEPETRLHWEWLSTTSMGFHPSGSPSKTRSCLSALLGVDPEEKFSVPNISELEGKRAKVFLEVGFKKDGSKFMKSIKYSKI